MNSQEWDRFLSENRWISRAYFVFVVVGAVAFFNVFWGSPRELTVLLMAVFGSLHAASWGMLPRSDRGWLLKWPVTALGFAAAMTLPLAIFGPVGGLRFWVMAAIISIYCWWWGMTCLTRWDMPVMSRPLRAIISLGLAGVSSWAFAIHPNPDRLNQLFLATCCIAVGLMFWRGWANRWFPIQGAEPIVVQAPV